MLLDCEDDTDLIWSCDVINNLKHAPSVADVEPTRKWISVKDRLPDRDGEYVVYGQTEAMRELLPDVEPIWICNYYKQYGFYNLDLRREYDFITHWMPMPEAPEEKRNE